MMHVLVTISPRMYREAVASSIRYARPGSDVRVAPPEEAGGEIASFRPDLLVHDGAAPPIGGAAVASVPCRVEVLYSERMDARIVAYGEIGRLEDASTADLLAYVDRAAPGG